MILATYQPINPKKKDSAFKDICYDDLGFNPVWCFNADTLYDFWINSFLTVPVCPEKLIVFETEEYWAIDKSQWYNALHAKGEKPKVISKDSIRDVNNVEFLVREIENVLYEVDIKKSIYDRISQEEKENILEPAIKRVESQLTDLYNMANYNMTYERFMQNNIAEKYREAYASWNQYAIEDYRNNLHKGYNIEIDTTYISRNDKLYALLDEYGSENTSYELYCKIRRELEKAVKEKKIYPNDMCPCGSGKKYKKCCMRK